MARSYRRAPFIGCCTRGSDRAWKRIWHRRVRHINRQRVETGLEPLSELLIGDPWLSPKDGKVLVDEAWALRK